MLATWADRVVTWDDPNVTWDGYGGPRVDPEAVIVHVISVLSADQVANYLAALHWGNPPERG